MTLYRKLNIAQKVRTRGKKKKNTKQETMEAGVRLEETVQSTEAEFLIPGNHPLWFFLQIRLGHAFRSHPPAAAAISNMARGRVL